MQRGDAGRRSFLVYLGTEGKGTFSSRLCSIWITEWPIIPPRRKWLTSSPRLKKKGDLTGSFARLKSESNWKVTFPWGWLKNCLWEHSWMGGGARRGFSGVKRICAFMGWEEHSSKKKKTLLSYQLSKCNGLGKKNQNIECIHFIHAQDSKDNDRMVPPGN